MVHRNDQHGESEFKQHEHGQELASVDDETANDDGPGSKEVVEGQKVQDLHAAAQERQPTEQVPDVDQHRPVRAGRKEGGHVDPDGNHVEKNYDNFN